MDNAHRETLANPQGPLQRERESCRSWPGRNDPESVLRASVYLSQPSFCKQAGRQGWEQRIQVSAIVFWEAGCYCFGYWEMKAKYQGPRVGGRKGVLAPQAGNGARAPEATQASTGSVCRAKMAQKLGHGNWLRLQRRSRGQGWGVRRGGEDQKAALKPSGWLPLTESGGSQPSSQTPSLPRFPGSGGSVPTHKPKYLSKPGFPQLSHVRVPPISLDSVPCSVPTATILVQASAFLPAHCTSLLASHSTPPPLSPFTLLPKFSSPGRIWPHASMATPCYTPDHPLGVAGRTCMTCPASPVLPHQASTQPPELPASPPGGPGLS